MTTYFTVQAMVRGYHIYKEIWESSVREQLICEIEETNRQDSHVVAVVKSRTVVGHVPQNISLICTLFLHWTGSSICCEVTGERRYSWDLPQGGLDVPCKLHFKGTSETYRQSAAKAEKLIRRILQDLVTDNL